MNVRNNTTKKNKNPPVKKVLTKNQSIGSVKRIKDEDSSEDKRDNINDEIVDIDEIVEKDNSAQMNQPGIKDIKKINENPENYARNVSVERLVTILQKMSDYYYSTSRDLVEDDVYDIMVDVLQERDPNNAFLFQTGVEKTTNKDVELPYPMPSLNKIKPGEKPLVKYFKTFKGPYMFMDKLDGISLQDYKNPKGHSDLFTKKQTGMGTSKKHLMKYLIPKKVQDVIPNDTSIRGEMVISKTDFELVKEIDPSLKNERSAMSGLVNTDKIDTRIAEKAQFVTYGILNADTKISEQLENLEGYGLTTVWHQEYTLEELMTHDDIDEDDDDGFKAIEENLKDILTERRSLSEFLADGIVITDNSKAYPHISENPKHSIAFKMNSTVGMKNVVVEEIIWEPTMYSYLQPVVRTKPIILSGNTSCTHFTAHNAKYVYDNKIGKGTVIKVVRSGDVIPYIVSVVKPAKKADMPEMEYEWNDTAVDIIVINPSNMILRKIKIKRNLHLFKKLGVKFLSEATMAKLYDFGYDSVESIVVAASNKDTEPYNISGLGQKFVTKIYDQIDRAFGKIKLPDLMAGSLKFGQGLGAKKIREIIKMYPNILAMKDYDEDDIKENILKVPGFSNNLAGKFARNLKSFCEFLDELRENSDYDLSFKPPKKETVIKSSGKSGLKKVKKDDVSGEKSEDDVGDYDMSKEVVVITGFRNDNINEFIEKNGGRMGSSISGKTTLVVYANEEKSFAKLQKAKDLGIKLMTRIEFENKYDIV
jgi:DNA ligase (NAD+)